jgi:hypothetical protein
VTGPFIRRLSEVGQRVAATNRRHQGALRRALAAVTTPPPSRVGTIQSPTRPALRAAPSPETLGLGTSFDLGTVPRRKIQQLFKDVTQEVFGDLSGAELRNIFETEVREAFSSPAMVELQSRLPPLRELGEQACRYIYGERGSTPRDGLYLLLREPEKFVDFGDTELQRTFVSAQHEGADPVAAVLLRLGMDEREVGTWIEKIRSEQTQITGLIEQPSHRSNPKPLKDQLRSPDLISRAMFPKDAADLALTGTIAVAGREGPLRVKLVRGTSAPQGLLQVPAGLMLSGSLYHPAQTSFLDAVQRHSSGNDASDIDTPFTSWVCFEDPTGTGGLRDNWSAYARRAYRRNGAQVILAEVPIDQVTLNLLSRNIVDEGEVVLTALNPDHVTAMLWIHDSMPHAQGDDYSPLTKLGEIVQRWVIDDLEFGPSVEALQQPDSPRLSYWREGATVDTGSNGIQAQGLEAIQLLLDSERNALIQTALPAAGMAFLPDARVQVTSKNKKGGYLFNHPVHGQLTIEELPEVTLHRGAPFHLARAVFTNEQGESLMLPFSLAQKGGFIFMELDVAAALDRLSQQWAEQLTATERGALEIYRTPGQYFGLNYFARNGVLHPRHSNHSKLTLEQIRDELLPALESAISKAPPTPWPLTAYRVFDLPLEGSIKGKQLLDPAPMSMTVSSQTAKGYEYGRKSHPRRVVVEIQVPAGTSAAYVEAFLQKPPFYGGGINERELLAFPGHSLLFTSEVEQRDGVPWARAKLESSQPEVVADVAASG